MSLIYKLWKFIWYDDSILSWIVNIALALILVKFVIYPGLGLFLGTTHPLVAVVSSSMEHNSQRFDDWWEVRGSFYEENKITKKTFRSFDFKNGFNKGDIMLLKKDQSIEVGDVIVYTKANSNDPPIIHRVVNVDKAIFQTKGDNVAIVQPFEQEIKKDAIIGKAVLRIPFLGYIKIWFVDLFINPIIRIFK